MFSPGQGKGIPGPPQLPAGPSCTLAKCKHVLSPSRGRQARREGHGGASPGVPSTRSGTPDMSHPRSQPQLTQLDQLDYGP